MDIVWVVIVLLILFGLCFGSLVNAVVWRLYKKKDFVKGRSECPKCHHILAWYDLVPVVSWIILRGKCRYCHRAISWQYPVVEASVAVLFVLSYVVWPGELMTEAGIVLFVLWLVAVVLMTILFVYDIRWLLLPNKIVFPLIGVGLLIAIIRLIEAPDMAQAALNVLYSLLILAGLYYVLYFISQGKWVGFGDVKLCIFLGLLLGDWRLAILTLFLANFFGCLVVLPGIVLGVLSRTTRVPFGPMLIAGAVVAFLFGSYFIDWYMSTLLVEYSVIAYGII